jgi:hypothetical protein
MLEKKVFALKVAALSTVQTLNSPKGKVAQADRATILRQRAEHKGARRIQNDFRLHEQRELSLATIHKVLSEASVKPLVRLRRPAHPKRYSRPVPGDRPDGQDEDRARRLSIYGQRRVLALQRAGCLSAQKCPKYATFS